MGAQRQPWIELEVIEPRVGARESAGFASGSARATVDDGEGEPVLVIPTVASGLPGRVVGSMEVFVRLRHGDTNDLDIDLIHRDSGRRARLFSGLDAKRGRDFDGTVFSDESLLPIGEAVAPYAGTYSPEEPLEVFVGLPIDGAWELEIFDASFDGVLVDLLGWGITFHPVSSGVTYAHWAEGVFDPDAANSAATEDFDGDGISNRVSYGLVREPAVAGATFAIDRGPHGTVLMRHARWTAPVDIAYRYEYSFDLNTWTPATEGVHYDFARLIDFGEGVQEVTLAPREQMFLRVDFGEP